jgi:hypothetical protein
MNNGAKAYNPFLEVIFMAFVSCAIGFGLVFGIVYFFDIDTATPHEKVERFCENNGMFKERYFVDGNTRYDCVLIEDEKIVERYQIKYIEGLDDWVFSAEDQAKTKEAEE